VLNTDTGEHVAVTVEDQVAITGLLATGAVASLHTRGATPGSTKLLWEINGTEGDLLVTGRGNLTVGASLRGCRAGDDLAELVLPDHYEKYHELVGRPAHAVAHAYDNILHDLVDESQSVPSFADAVERHRLIDHIQRSATDGTRHYLDDVR
jgi:predicted dehydrogenase